jgi:phage shock protein A
MRIIGRLGRVLFGWLNLGVNSLESKNVDALIASLEDEKSKAEQEIYERLVAVKTTVNNMTKNVKSLKQKVQVLNERAILALKNGKESLAAEFSLQYENTKAQLDMAEKALEEATATYDKLISNQRAVLNSYDSRIEQIKLKAASAAMKEDLAALKDIANISGKNDFNGMLADVDKILEKKDSKADASIEVSGTLNDTKDEMNEFIESVSKEDALARLKARVAES